jgi:hypothetical protein
LRVHEWVKGVSVPVFVIILLIGIYAGIVVYEVRGLKLFVTFSKVPLQGFSGETTPILKIGCPAVTEALPSV